MLQVYLPYLEDTVEVLQVQRVLERTNVFLRLMHEGLTTKGPGDKKIDTDKEFIRGQHLPVTGLDAAWTEIELQWLVIGPDRDKPGQVRQPGKRRAKTTHSAVSPYSRLLVQLNGKLILLA